MRVPEITSREIAGAGATVARGHDLHAVRRRRARVCLLPRRGSAYRPGRRRRPAFAIEQYLEEAERRDVRIVRVVETHTHADHLAGHGRFALEHGVPVSVHSAAEAEFPHDALEDGDEIALGDIVLRCIHTPGHRPEHCCLAVSDLTRGPEPWIVLTGDSLFVGDAARPDLAVEAREGAEGLFHSLRRLVELGDGVEVYPGHVAGSLCGKAMSSKASTTIGFERRFNPALAARRRRALRRGGDQRLGTAPAEHGADRRPEPRAVRRGAAGAGGARLTAGRSAGARRPPRRGVRGRPPSPARSASRSRERPSERRPGSSSTAARSSSSHPTRTRRPRRFAVSTRSESSMSPATCSEAAPRRSSSSRSSSSTSSSNAALSSSTSARRTSGTRATSPGAGTSRIACSRSARPTSRATGRS